jgi:hypothetical protein
LFVLRYKIIMSPARVREAALREFRASAAAMRMAQIRCARAIRAVESTDAHRTEGAASIGEFAERNGVSAHEARVLSGLGRALEDDASIVNDVASGAIPVASAAVLGDVATTPALRKPGDRWIDWARTQPTSYLRRLYFQRRDEVLQGAAVLELTAYVTPKVRDDLSRASDLASRSARASLTLGQTLGVLSDEYLERHDPLRTTPGARRTPETSTLPDSRYIPEDVDREVRKRSGDVCIIPLCGRRRFLHRSHRIPHRDGSGREAKDLDLLCDWHHFLYEIGELVITGPADHPEFRDRQGRLLSERRVYVLRGPRPLGPASREPPSDGATGGSEPRDRSGGSREPP